jgi:molybdate transport system permease protein
MDDAPPDLSPFWISIRVASVAMLLVMPTGTLLAWWLAHGRRVRFRALVETLLSLPLVLPPTVVGFYLLGVFGRGTAFGRWLNDRIGIHLLFTWEGATIAAAVMALPLFLRTATAAFASVDRELLDAGRELGAGEWSLLWRVVVPLAYRGLLAALALAFARALGEFGATFMVAGSLPGRTETLPLALYTAVQNGDNQAALLYTGALTLAALLLMGAVGIYESRLARHRGER